jgi:PqqD family protein of HPr-rel-A system
MKLILSAYKLVWRELNNLYIVYQPSSTETHVFNETTATILRCLDQGPLTLEALAAQVAQSLALAPDELAIDDLIFATNRLEALGLVDWINEALPAA